MPSQPNPTQTGDCDQAQRLRSLSVNHSFIVQAPAGSGKTELLTQRYLALLATVQQAPEEIIAITFTRKAASEMRQRIISALHTAQSTTVPPERPHERQTYELAKKALQRNQQCHWGLLTNPNRLRIQTIDSFCGRLVRQMPTRSHFGTQLTPTDMPQRLYRQAVEQLLTQLDGSTPSPPSLLTLLYHLDNDLSQVETLCMAMLRYRDQWLPHIIRAKYHPSLREHIESGLTALTSEQINLIESAFPKGPFSELIELADFAAQTLKLTHPDHPILYCQPPPIPSTPLPQQRQFWLGLCELLFTRQGQLRKRLDKNCGFPIAQTAEDKPYYEAMKQRMKTWLQWFATQPDLMNSLLAFQAIPPPHYTDEAWQIVEALLEILPLLVAELRLVFQQNNQVDFIEISQAALVALGDEEAPTDLALALDYRLSHILIDEFQDTSIAQFHLLEKLLAGWQPEDGRTLFAVGDPMQSIYRFRQAEVGLFLRAKQQGIGPIKLESITLTQNFRANQPIVEWLNQSFNTIFPKQNDIRHGAIAYSRATTRPAVSTDGGVYFHHANDPSEEASQIVSLVKQAMLSGDKTLALLIQARSQLNTILPALKQANLPYQAVDIEPLAKQPIIKDLLSLTRALLYPADRIAWLSVLRAPWCGLTLKSLHQLVRNCPAKQKTVWQCLQETTRLHSLPPTERQRLGYFRQVIAQAFTQRRRHTLRVWVEQTFQALQGSSTLQSTNDTLATLSYFNFLDTIEQSGDILSLKTFNQQLETLYASHTHQKAPLQILTIHKSKGLEFDTVIVAGLGFTNRSKESPLLLWHEQPRQLSATNDLILAPIRAGQAETHEPIYHYLQQQEAIKVKNEARRLLYVATTRAKRILHLSGHFERETAQASPPNDSLLALLWPVVRHQCPPMTAPVSAAQSHASPPPLLYRYSQPINRLPQPFFQTLPTPPIMELSVMNAPSRLKFQPPYQTLIGSAIHLILQQIANQGLDHFSTQSIQTYTPNWQALLRSLGVAPDKLEIATTTLQTAISNIIDDAQGRWILCQYAHHDTELALTQQGNPFIIDRTFIDQQGDRWIIDYKITEQSTDTLQDQLESDTHPWRQQLMQYANLFTTLETHPVRCALYLPLQAIFIEL